MPWACGEHVLKDPNQKAGGPRKEPRRKVEVEPSELRGGAQSNS